MNVHPRVLVVGAGWRFTSGISYYTCRLTNAFAERVPTDALLVRRLVPRALYPGRRRVGTPVHDLAYDPRVTVQESLDWYWGRSILQATGFLRQQAPDVVVLQWWTGAVLHSYLLLATLARRRGARVIMEWHEVQDTGEARIPGVTRYVRSAMRRLMDQVDGHVVHSQHDLELLRDAYGLDLASHPVTMVPHGPYDHVLGDGGDDTQMPVAPRSDDFTILFFGIIRPFKGLEDLVAAFETVAQGRPLRLRIVGETWEGWNEPLEAVAASPVRDQIDVVNRYVTDEEARRHFAEADAVVLPYRRSSASGPLHMAMSAGLPVVVTAVGGLVDAASDYEGVTFVPPQDRTALAEAIAALPARRGERYTDPHSWDRTIDAYMALIEDAAPVASPALSPQTVGSSR